jgi:error-prone DNA polymerase
MVVAGFSGGEAEDLRRAMGFKRSEKRMREIEAKLRAGMERNGISREAQEQIVLSITSFALYGFPESHAASFALIAYASAYLKCHYLAAFTAALLNNQPMGFYSPATIVKDAQRHGLKVLPVDVTRSEWECTLEQQVVGRCSSVVGEELHSQAPVFDNVVGSRSSVVGKDPATEWQQNAAQGASSGKAQPLNQAPKGRNLISPARECWEDQAHNSKSRRDGTIALRLGLRYVRGLHEEAGRAIARERNRAPFASIHDLVHRIPELRKDELNTLAEIGALNSIGLQIETSHAAFDPKNVSAACDHQSEIPNRKSPLSFHRRDALWSVAAAANPAGPLLEQIPEADIKSPLKIMGDEERLVADFRGTGMTVGPHPMSYHRARMERMGVRRAIDLKQLPGGRKVRIAGGVIARQRPGTAKGFVFLSLEDETGVSNAIVNPDLFQQNRLLLGTEQFLLIEGILQNKDGVISVKALRVAPIKITQAHTVSHDFH